MDRRAFEHHLGELLRAPVTGLTLQDKAAVLRRHAEAFLNDGSLERFTAGFEPFVPGRRPDDEAAWPGLGSSEAVALFHAGRTPDDTLTLLVRCHEEGRPVADFPADAHVFATIEALDHTGAPVGTVTGWDRRDVRDELRPFEQPSSSSVPTARALVLDVERSFDPATVPIDPARYLGFGSLFHQRFRIGLDVEAGGARVAGGEHEFEIHNEELYGSLYQRLVDVLLPWDTARQASLAKKDVPIQVHPWYPVLSIGMQKARFYMLAITGDLVEQKRMLTDPGWLLRVGLYLELLTCLGVAEAVKDEIDILTSEERDRFENDPAFAEIRARIDVAAWRKVWAMREIAFGGGVGGAPTGALNLMRKRNATLGFLHAHHEDLKHAIDLAGPNLQNAQESWHRVFRDAERAVLQMNADAFPELAQFPAMVRDFALWHQSGGLGGLRLLPRQITELFGDQDGIFPSACRQYRASMNHIAAWARERGLMEYTGEECVPLSASLLEAYLAHQHGRLAGLQRRDGYAGTLEVVVQEAERPDFDPAAVVELLGRVEVFSVLSVDELHALARGVRPIHLGHLERIIVQGRAGSSLFILQDGTLEVIAREDGTERQVALLTPPAIVGELAFLLGSPRSATVRALDEATVLEVGAALLRPLVEERPIILEGLEALLRARTPRGEGAPSGGSLLDTLRVAIFGKG